VLHGHALRASLRALGLIFAAALVAVVGSAWILARGPVAVPMLRPVIERALDRALTGAGVPMGARVGGVVLAWQADAGVAGLEIDLINTRLTDDDGRTVARLGTVAVDLDPGALLLGEVTVRGLTLVGPDLRLVRAADGAVSLDLAGLAAGVTTTGAGPHPDLAPDPAPLPADPGAFLAEVLETWAVLADMGFAVRDARLSVVDQGDGDVVSVSVERLRLRPQGEALLLEGTVGVSGDGDVVLAGIDLALRHRPGADLAALLLMLRDLDPARHLALHPGLTDLGDWRQPLSGTLAVDLDLAALAAWAVGRAPSPLAPMRFAHLSLTGGPGGVTLPAPVDRDYRLRRLALDATLSAGAEALDVADLTLDLEGATLVAAGRLEGLVEGGPRATATLTLSPMTVPTLLSLWPGRLAHGGYTWIRDNMADGGVGEGRFTVSLAGADWGSVSVTALEGEAWANGLTVRYLGDLPPATGAAGRLTFGLESIDIDQITGAVGPLSVTEGRLEIADFDKDYERADMTFRIDGPLSAALALIDHQPLGYATAVGIDPPRARGRVETTLIVALPLIKDVGLEAVSIGVEARATDVGLPEVALGQDLEGGDLSLTLDNEGMDVTGRARLGSVPAALDWREVFTDGAAFDRRYTVRGRVDTAARARFGLDGPPFAPPWMDGPADVDLTYTERAGRPGHLEARVDLTPTTMSVPALGWRKPPGVGGRVTVNGRFDDQAMTVGFDLMAVPDQASAAGEARLSAAGDLRGLTLSRLRLGRTDVRAEVVAPPAGGDPWRVALTGPLLDGAALMADDEGEDEKETAVGEEGKPESPTPSAAPSGPPLDMSLDVQRLLLPGDITLETARVGLTRDAAGRWQRARVDGRINGGPPVSLRLEPGADGQRRFTLTADDAGAVARALDINRALRGGRFTLTGTLDDAGVARGRLEATDLFLAEAPVLVRLLAVASLTGILEELQGEGLSLSTLVVPFTYAAPLLTLRAARANGPSLGLTASGTLNLDADTLDLEGVVVPAYLVNSLLGKIPLVGDLLVGEAGGGVFAVDYSAEGAMDDPRIAVNPLTLLTPGILREVFGVLPDGPQDGGTRTGAGDDPGNDAEAVDGHPGPGPFERRMD